MAPTSLRARTGRPTKTIFPQSKKLDSGSWEPQYKELASTSSIIAKWKRPKCPPAEWVINYEHYQLLKEMRSLCSDRPRMGQGMFSLPQNRRDHCRAWMTGLPGLHGADGRATQRSQVITWPFPSCSESFPHDMWELRSSVKDTLTPLNQDYLAQQVKD